MGKTVIATRQGYDQLGISMATEAYNLRKLDRRVFHRRIQRFVTFFGFTVCNGVITVITSNSRD